MKFYTIFLILTIVLPISLLSISKSEPTIIYSSIEPKQTVLAEYGKYIYESEGCFNCHTLKVDINNKSLVSLDGYAGRRSIEFLYDLLKRPKDLMPGSSMPEFAHLHSTPLKKETFSAILKQKGVHNSEIIEASWKSLLNEADSIRNSFSDYYNSTPERSEVIALISFLNQIPTSNAQKYIDSLDRVEYLKEEEKWKMLFINSDSIIAQTSKNKDNISAGKNLFAMYCVVCHNEKAEGNIGPNLTDNYWLHGNDFETITQIIVNGTTFGMPEHKSKLTPVQVGKLISYLNSVKSTNHKGKAPEGQKY